MNSSKDEFYELYSGAIASLSLMTELIESLDGLINQLKTAPQERPQIVEKIALLTSRMLVAQAKAAPTMGLLHENPSLFKRHPMDGLDHVWKFRRDWHAAFSKLSAYGERFAALTGSLPPIDVAATERAQTQALKAESRAVAAEGWLALFADALRHARRYAGRRPVLIAPVPMTGPIAGDVAELAGIIRQSNLFDVSFYLSQLTELLPLHADPIVHYIMEGWQNGLDPHPLFSTAFYLSRDPELVSARVEPFSHYIRVGATEMRDPHPLFLTSFYRAQRGLSNTAAHNWLSDFLSEANPPSPHPLFDPVYYAQSAGLPKNNAALGLLHYLVVGWRHQLPLSPMFDAAFYKSQWAEGSVTTEPYSHYVYHGIYNELDPHPLFDAAHYLRQRIDRSAVDPLVDFITEGEAAGASPSPFFNPIFYRDRYRPAKPFQGSLLHFLTEGAMGDHWPNATFASDRYRQTFMPGLVPASGHSAIEHFLTQGVLELSPENLPKLVGQVPPPASASAATTVKPDVPAVAQKPVDINVAPEPEITASLGEKLRYKQYPGKSPYVPGRPNVLIVAHAAAEFLFGSERSFLDMIAGLCSVPANIYVVLPKNAPNYTNAIRPSCQYVSVFDYGWWRKDEAPSDEARTLFVDLIKSLRIDAVHCNTIMLRECLEAARECKVQSIVHVRELITEDEALINLIGQPPEEIIEAIRQNTDWVIGNSAITAKIFEKADRTFVIPNTVDIKQFDIPNPIDPKKIRFGLISSNIPKKGLADVVELARLAETSCPEAEFLLIGPKTTAVAEIVQQQEDGLAPRNIVFPGYAKTPTEAIAQVQVVLNFSHFAESFGRTVLEAMAAGRPVIAYEWGALPELVQHGTNGFLVPFKQPQDALQYVEQFCKNPASIADLGEAGRKIACDRYGIEQYGQSFREAYAEIIQQQQLSMAAKDPVIRAARLPGLKEVEEKPRIAYFCWHFPVPSETFVLNEIEVLVRNGYDVIVFCRQSPYKTFQPSFEIKYERVDSADTLARRLKETERTIVHAHFVYPTVTDMVWPACEAAEIPFTFIAHAQDIFKYDNQKKNRLAEIGASKWCRKMFTLSRFHFDFVVECGFPRDKIVINPNAVDTERFQTASVPGREDRPHRKIISIHRYVPKKGLTLLIRAAALIQDLGIKIEIYGYGDCEAEYRALVAELGLDNVLIGSQLTQDEVVEKLKGADLFACPSIRTPEGDMDGIPTSIVESMAAGIPILATDVAGIPDLVVDGVTGMLAEADPESLAAAIRRFYTMPSAQVRAMIDAARARAIHNHDAKRLVRVLTRVWENRATDIIIVSWNNLTELRGVVARVIANTALPYHLIICDNQSEREPVPEYLDSVWEEHERVTVIHNNSNAMVGPGTNACLEQGNSDVAIYVCGKEGFSFANGWELPFIHAFDADPEAGLVGTIGRSPTYLTGSQYPKGISLFSKFRNQDFAANNPDRIFGHAQGGLFAMRRSMVDDIGGFSYDVPHDYTDVEYSYYVESRGWKIIEAPGVLALFNKSRPTLSQRFDENVLIAHPVLLPQIETFDAVRAGKLFHCNICDWFGEAFIEEGPACPECGSKPADRTLFRWLAESPYMYRRLPALNVGLEGQMDKTWAEQFQGPRLPKADFLEQLRTSGRLKNGNGACHLGVLRLAESDVSDYALIARELNRLIKPGGVILVQGETPQDDWREGRDALTSAMREFGFTSQPDLLYTSRALQFAYTPMLAFARS